MAETDGMETITKTSTIPSILESGIEYAIGPLKNHKTPDHENIYAEVLKLLDATILGQLSNKIYKSGHVPMDWFNSTFIAIPKKTNTKCCKELEKQSLA